MTEGSQIFNVSATFLLCSPDQLKNMFILLFVQFVANGEQIGDSGGLNWTGSSIQTDSEPMCFHRANLQIFSECGTHSADKKAETLNLALHPPFCQTAVSTSFYFCISINFHCPFGSFSK